MREAQLVTTQADLDAALFRMHGARRFALDTEFMRESSYYPQLCLVQVATDSDCFLIDPLAGLELGGLHELLAQRALPKILHAARQDLEVLFLSGGRVPGPVFDTQVAAALLGAAPQLGYADLVASRLGHSLDKAQTRTDWSRRPLTDAQLAYAADDVRHLLQLHTELTAELEARGRAGWLAEDAAALEDPALYRGDPGLAWRRLKGLGRLKPAEQAAARALAVWREQRAMTADRPRGWILADESLYALALRRPASLDELGAIPALPAGTVRRSGEELLALIATARDAPAPDDLEPPPQRPTPEQQALQARLMQTVRGAAEALGIGPEVLATRRDVDALAQGDRNGALLRGWRREAIGLRLLAVLDARGGGPGSRPPPSRSPRTPRPSAGLH